ncbi:MAG: hypothetical protein JNM59_06835 [Hyphomonadaceae bacterium]|nr:hypothetical protein [Hyphomonadaceae bacterium]
MARKRFAEKLHENLDADLAKDEQKLATSILEFVDRKSLKHEKAEYTAAELSLNKSLSELSDQEAQALIKNFAGETERAKAAIARIIAHSVVGMRS